MSEAPAANSVQVKPRARSRVAILLLLLILAFVGYGVFERFQLAAAQENEQRAVEVVRSLKGMTVESSSDDWRIVFVPDSPHLAKRVGGLFIPNEGNGPGYTDKVMEQLRIFGRCEELNISSGPLSGGMSSGPARKRILKPGETPPELLDIAAIKKEFPHLKVTGEQYLVPGWEYAAETPAKEDEPKKEAPSEQNEKPSKEGE
jgi:hypothetical protein